MPRRKKEIPIEDVKYYLKGLKTLIHEGKIQEEIAEYYRQNGIDVDQTTISRRMKELNEGYMEFVGAKIISIHYPIQHDGNVECTEVVIEKDGKTYVIHPHLSENPELCGPINLIIAPTFNPSNTEEQT